MTGARHLYVKSCTGATVGSYVTDTVLYGIDQYVLLLTVLIPWTFEPIFDNLILLIQKLTKKI